MFGIAINVVSGTLSALHFSMTCNDAVYMNMYIQRAY
jgi:hypothetical protein